MNNVNVIIGLGITGFSCAKYCQTNNLPFVMMDTRQNPANADRFHELFPDAKLILGKLDEDILRSANRIILSPGIAKTEPAIQTCIEKGIPVIGDIELFAEANHAKVIAITGTNAKSTVTTLVGLMAKACGYNVEVGGNLGVPALTLLAQNPHADLFVLELSSFQLETTYSLKPNVATILNITPDHMDRYETFADYQNAKHKVYENAEIAIYNLDDELTIPRDENLSTRYAFTLEKTPGKHQFGLLNKEGELYLAYENECLLNITELPIHGRHHQANVLAALAIGYAMKFPMETMLSVLKTFKGLPHRCQLVRERHDVKWYNDSKGTNVGATIAAIVGLGKEGKGRLILIAGGVGKHADFSPLVPVIKQYVRHVVLIGEAANELATILTGNANFSFATSMQEAVEQADVAAKPQDSVLLSPACASFDMFKHFEHRGDVFTEVVMGLI